MVTSYSSTTSTLPRKLRTTARCQEMTRAGVIHGVSRRVRMADGLIMIGDRLREANIAHSEEAETRVARRG